MKNNVKHGRYGVARSLWCCAHHARSSLPAAAPGPDESPKETRLRYVFGDFTLDPARYELRRAGELVAVEPRAFDLLAYLVQHAGQIVPKEELFTQLWAEQFVTDSALTYCVTEVRKAIGDSGRGGQRFIRLSSTPYPLLSGAS